MSKKCLMIFLVFFSAKSLMAQHLSIGPTAGIGHSWISTDNENTNNKSRFHPAYNVGVKLVYNRLITRCTAIDQRTMHIDAVKRVRHSKPF